MRTLLTALTALMLFATPVVAGDYQKAFRLWKPLAEQGNVDAQFNLGLLDDTGGRIGRASL